MILCKSLCNEHCSGTETNLSGVLKSLLYSNQQSQKNKMIQFTKMKDRDKSQNHTPDELEQREEIISHYTTEAAASVSLWHSLLITASQSLHHFQFSDTNFTFFFFQSKPNLFISNWYETYFQILWSLYHRWVSWTTECRRQWKLQSNLAAYRSRTCRQSCLMIPGDQYWDMI